MLPIQNMKNDETFDEINFAVTMCGWIFLADERSEISYSCSKCICRWHFDLETGAIDFNPVFSKRHRINHLVEGNYQYPWENIVGVVDHVAD